MTAKRKSKKTPPRPKKPGSTAASTKFCLAEIQHKGRRLWLDGNEKITTGDTFDDPRPNSLSLLPVIDCPGVTPTCRKACYVNGLEKAKPDIFRAYSENSTTIRKAVSSMTGGTWAGVLAKWIQENASEGFRWHVSGDVFSWSHAKWIRSVCRLTPEVPHWIYTRSFKCLGPLLEAENLAINLSADGDNIAEAERARESTGGKLRICYLLTEDEKVPLLPADSVIFPDYPLRARELKSPKMGKLWRSLTPVERGMVCEADFFGKSEKRRCWTCKRCTT